MPTSTLSRDPQARPHRVRLGVLAAIAASMAGAGPALAQSLSADSALIREPAPFLALSVANLDRQINWYCDTLGFSVYAQGQLAGHPIRFALLREGTVLLELLQVEGAQPRHQAAPGAKDPSEILGFFKGGMIVRDVERLYRLLQARGVPFLFPLSQPPHGPYRAFGIRDPEGNVLQFFGP